MTLPSTNLMYPKGLDALLQAQIDVIGMNIAAYALDASYSYDETDQFVADLGTSVKGGPINLTAKAVASGNLTVGAVTFPAATGGPWLAFAIAENTGTPAVDQLIALIVQNSDSTPINQGTVGAAITYVFAFGLLLRI